jgi:predicted transcriptional regulator
MTDNMNVYAVIGYKEGLFVESTWYVVASTLAEATTIGADKAEDVMSVQRLGAAVFAMPPAESNVVKATPEQIEESIQPDHLVNFEDGKNYKSLKRNLAIRGLTPAQYREKWGLPADYPMVAPNYSATRSALAKANGLGQKR